MARFLEPDESIGDTGRVVGDFWMWAFSDLVANTTRSAFAEFLVGHALGVLDSPRVSWDAVDLRYRDRAVEVKAAGMAQAWATTRPAMPRFDIGVKRGWDAALDMMAETAVRAADCFVFCLHASIEADPTSVLDPARWEFYVVPTRDLDRQFLGQRSLGLGTLRGLVDPVALDSLRSVVDDALAGPTCPYCGVPDARPILYGLPAVPPPEDVVTGGCVVSPDGSDPTHECRGPDSHRFTTTR